MVLRLVIDVLRSIETQSVQVKFLDPVSGIRDKILADRPTLFRLRIDRFTPVGFVFRCKVVAGK
jgi:hypothetical protein